MDIVYQLGKGCSQSDDFEIRYSLRSIEKYGKNIGKVYVAGYCPEWLSENVIKVPCEQPIAKPKDIVERHINMLYTLLYVVDNTDISDEFLISMDDHFYVRDVDFDNYPYYEKIFGPNNELPEEGKTPYKKLLAKTRAFCVKNKVGYQYLTLHRNMHCSRAMISETRTILNNIISKKTPCEYQAFLLNWWKTKHGLESTAIKDVRLQDASEWWKTDPRETEVFSTANFDETSGLYVLIQSLYPEKSKYEL